VFTIGHSPPKKFEEEKMSFFLRLYVNFEEQFSAPKWSLHSTFPHAPTPFFSLNVVEY